MKVAWSRSRLLPATAAHFAVPAPGFSLIFPDKVDVNGGSVGCASVCRLHVLFPGSPVFWRVVYHHLAPGGEATIAPFYLESGGRLYLKCSGRSHDRPQFCNHRSCEISQEHENNSVVGGTITHTGSGFTSIFPMIEEQQTWRRAEKPHRRVKCKRCN